MSYSLPKSIVNMQNDENKRISPFFLVPVAFGLGVLLWPVCRYLETLIAPQAARILLILLVLLGTATMISYMIPISRFRSILHGIGEFFYPLFLTVLTPMLVLDVLYYFGIEINPKKAVFALAAVFLLLTGIGLIEGTGLKVRLYKAVVKDAAPLRTVLVSDLHFGFFTPGGFGENLAEAILKEKPEAVIIAGDLFDDRFDALSGRRRERIRAGLEKLTQAVPVYACEGNHDLLYTDERKEAFLKSCGIRMLYDESILIKGIRFVFRRDIQNDDRQPAKDLYANSSLPTVVVDHNPSQHGEAWEHGAALVLSGHTHGGQSFPGTLIYKFRRVYGYGFIRENGKQLIVTSGAGIYGCPVRLGAAREIAVVEIGAENGDQCGSKQ